MTSEAVVGRRRPRVVLVGPMGAGKSTVGSLLAEGWGVVLRDTDEDQDRPHGAAVIGRSGP